MSAKRRAAGSDDKILAKLERGTPAGAARHGAAPSVAWLGAGGCAIAVLIGALVWVAYVNATTPRPLPPERSKPFPISQAAPEAKQAPKRAEPAAAPAEAPVQLAAALILDEPAEHYLPPPKPAAANKSAPRAATVRQAAYTAQPARSARGASARGRSKANPVPAQASAEPVPDSDVALLSAMLAHSPRHSAEGGQTESAPACDNATDPEKKCPVKSGSLLQALRKTTN